MQCNFTCGIAMYTYLKEQKTAPPENTCWLCDQLDPPSGLHVNPLTITTHIKYIIKTSNNRSELLMLLIPVPHVGL